MVNLIIALKRLVFLSLFSSFRLLISKEKANTIYSLLSSSFLTFLVKFILRFFIPFSLEREYLNFFDKLDS